MELSDEAAGIAAEIQKLFDQRVAGCEQPTLSHTLPFPCDDTGGSRLPWSDSKERPTEKSFSNTDDSTRATIWKSVVEEVAAGWASFRSGRSAGRLFLGPKDRLIYWPFLVNKALSKLAVHYGRVSDLFTTLVTLGIKFDIKSAYRAIRVCEEDAQYLGAVLDGMNVVFERLPFGLSASPAYFTWTLMASIRRARGKDPEALQTTLSAWVDDIGSGGPTAVVLLGRARHLILSLMQEGWWLSSSKSFFLPVLKLYYTGVIVDFGNQATSLALGKLSKLRDHFLRMKVPTQQPSTCPHPNDIGETIDLSATLELPSWITPTLKRPPLRLVDTPLPAEWERATDLRLDTASFGHLLSVIGTLAWMQCVLPCLGFLRRSLERVKLEGIWDRAAIEVCEWFVMHALALADRPRAVRAECPSLRVIVDASGTGWGATLTLPDGRVIRLAGVFPPQVQRASSTAREAWGAVLAIHAALQRPEFTFRSISVTMDSSSCVAAAGGTARAYGLLPPLVHLTNWELQGLRIDFDWQSRDTPSHVKVDALSGAATDAWDLRREAASALWDRIDGWDVHLQTSEDLSLAAGYTTVAIPHAERQAILKGLEGEAKGCGVGWLSSDPEYVPTGRALAFPLFDHIPQLLKLQQKHRFPLALVAPLKGDDWWGPELAAHSGRCERLLRLHESSSTPPREHRREDRRQDPRPLACYLFDWGKQSAGRQRPVWWEQHRAEMISSDERGFRGGDGCTPADVRFTMGGKTKKDRPLTRDGRCFDPPVIPQPDRKRSLLAAFGAALAETDGKGLPPPPPARKAEGHQTSQPESTRGRGLLAALARVGGDSSASGTLHDTPAVAPTVVGHHATGVQAVGGGSAPPKTVSEWIDSIVGFMAGLTATVPDVAPAHSEAIRAAEKLRRDKANTGSSRVVTWATRMRDFAILRGVADYPYSPAEADAFVLDMLTVAMGEKRPKGWGQTTKASDASNIASAVAAASRRAGVLLPPHCGPLTLSFLESKGYRVKTQHSKAYPLPISWLLGARVAVGHPDRDVWEALLVMSLFALRTGIIFHVYAGMFIPYDDGFLFVWRHTQKAVPADISSLEALSEVCVVSAARHPVLKEILPGGDIDPQTRLFSRLTSERINRFVKERLPSAPPGFDIRAYGTRTAADRDATELELPDDLTNVLFWWKRVNVSMRVYYSGVNIRKLYIFSEYRAFIDYSSILPGRYDAYLRKDPPDWSRCTVSKKPLPPPPSPERIAAALRCVSYSLIIARRARAGRAQARARVALGIAKALPEVFEGSCARCGDFVSIEEDATLCEVCNSMVCVLCHALGEDYFCSAHASAAAAAGGH